MRSPQRGERTRDSAITDSELRSKVLAAKFSSRTRAACYRGSRDFAKALTPATLAAVMACRMQSFFKAGRVRNGCALSFSTYVPLNAVAT